MPQLNPPNEQENAVMLISYKTLRTIIGILGMFLSLILVIGMAFIGNGYPVQSSISHFYHTRMGDVFVGLLTAISLFLFVYKGPEKRDHRAGNIAGILGLVVAFVPTVYHGDGIIEGYMFNRAPFNPQWTQYVHLTAAGIFLLVLTYFALVLFTQTRPGQTIVSGSRKWKRNMVYYICGGIMLLCVIGLVISFIAFTKDELKNSIIIFILESLALFAFGITWLVKGEQVILRD